MGSRGRTSAAALSVVAPASPAAVAAHPQGLTPSQGRIWDSVIASRGADLIAPEAYPVLVEYCRAAALANQIADELAKFETGRTKNRTTMQRWAALQAMQDRAARSVALLAGKLRLTPSSRAAPGTVGRNAAKGPKFRPWEADG